MFYSSYVFILHAIKKIKMKCAFHLGNNYFNIHKEIMFMKENKYIKHNTDKQTMRSKIN